jgi:hypothetical protein
MHNSNQRRYIKAITSSTTIIEVLRKLGFAGHDYLPVKIMMSMTGARLKPKIPKVRPVYYGPYYDKGHRKGYIKLGAKMKRMCLVKAKRLGIVKP